ncbi:MAG: ABC transporter substrate-binding protein [Clostridia bacterium]|nr:ABC transporter substrate-binding protein [Clostridia bacterium]
MKKLYAFLLALVFTLPSVCLTSCVVEEEEEGEDTSGAYYDVEVDDISYYEKFRDKNITINVYNWGEYISNGSEESLDVVGAFEKISGIKVNYTNYATNEDMYAKFKSGATSVYDVVIPSDYMIDKMIEEDMLEEINYDNIPNYQYIDEKFKSPDYDNTGEGGTAKFSVPYTWGTVGIIYNKKYITEEEASTWDILWNPEYKGQILMFSNSKDAFAIGLKKLGYSMNTTNMEEIAEASVLLREQKPNVQTYVMDQIFDKMQLEEAWIAPYYAGDALTMIENAAKNDIELGFAFPKEGTNIFIDAMCIPKGSRNKEAAEAFINFMCELEVMTANGEYIFYSTPSTQAKEMILSNMEEYMSEDEIERYLLISYPDEELIAKCESFINLPKDTNELIIRNWNDILIGIDEDSWWNKAILPVSIIIALGFCILIILLRYRKMQKKRARY